MARTTLTPVDLLGSYPTLPISANAADVAFAASDVANGNQVLLNGKVLVLVQNTDVAAQTITFDSVRDGLNRDGDITTYSVGASEFAAFGPFNPAGWKQSDGYLYINTSDADLKILCINIPN